MQQLNQYFSLSQHYSAPCDQLAHFTMEILFILLMQQKLRPLPQKIIRLQSQYVSHKNTYCHTGEIRQKLLGDMIHLRQMDTRVFCLFKILKRTKHPNIYKVFNHVSDCHFTNRLHPKIQETGLKVGIGNTCRF